MSTSTPAIDPATVPKSGELIVETRHEFLGYGLHESFCRVRVYTRGEHIIVVISETAGEGSVSNSICQIAGEILPDLVRANPTRRDSITWVEHLPARESYGKEFPDFFRRVAFDRFIEPSARVHTRESLGSFRSPNWKRMERSELESLIWMKWE